MDYLLKSIALKKEVRAYIVNNTDVVNEAITHHDLWPSAASVLGKTLTMGLLMGGMLKEDSELTIKINGNGPLKTVIVDANAKGEARGYVLNPHVNFVNANGGINDIMAIGDNGIIDVIKDLKLKDLFVSSIELTGNIANDFTYYFYESEQVKSVICLGIKINPDNKCLISGGLIIQLLPNASEETITYLEGNIEKLNNFSSLLTNNSLEEILNSLFDDCMILEKQDVKFKCNCSKESFKHSLLSLGKKTLQKIIEEDHHIETVCHYCNTKYDFSFDELQEILNKEFNYE